MMFILVLLSIPILILFVGLLLFANFQQFEATENKRIDKSRLALERGLKFDRIFRSLDWRVQIVNSGLNYQTENFKNVISGNNQNGEYLIFDRSFEAPDLYSHNVIRRCGVLIQFSESYFPHFEILCKENSKVKITLDMRKGFLSNPTKSEWFMNTPTGAYKEEVSQFIRQNEPLFNALSDINFERVAFRDDKLVWYLPTKIISQEDFADLLSQIESLLNLDRYLYYCFHSDKDIVQSLKAKEKEQLQNQP